MSNRTTNPFKLSNDPYADANEANEYGIVSCGAKTDVASAADDMVFVAPIDGTVHLATISITVAVTVLACILTVSTAAGDLSEVITVPVAAVGAAGVQVHRFKTEVNAAVKAGDVITLGIGGESTAGTFRAELFIKQVDNT